MTNNNLLALSLTTDTLRKNCLSLPRAVNNLTILTVE